MKIGTRALGVIVLATCVQATAAQSPTASLSSTASERQAGQNIAMRWRSAWNDHDAAALTRLFAPDATYEDMAFQAVFHGRAGVAAWVGITKQSIPDASVQVLEVFGTADRLTIRWRFRGTPKTLGPIAGTGRDFDVPAITILDLRNRLIVREQDFYNLADLERQIGLAAGAYVPAVNAGTSK